MSGAGQPQARRQTCRSPGSSLPRAAGRTFLAGQHVPYPFHITRPFHLDRARPDLATLYLQSASGGPLSRRLARSHPRSARGAPRPMSPRRPERWVHDTGVAPARQDTMLDLGPSSFLSLTCDPFILFPGAALTSATTVILDDGAPRDPERWFRNPRSRSDRPTLRRHHPRPDDQGQGPARSRSANGGGVRRPGVLLGRLAARPLSRLWVAADPGACRMLAGRSGPAGRLRRHGLPGRRQRVAERRRASGAGAGGRRRRSPGRPRGGFRLGLRNRVGAQTGAPAEMRTARRSRLPSCVLRFHHRRLAVPRGALVVEGKRQQRRFAPHRPDEDQAEGGARRIIAGGYRDPGKDRRC